MILQHSVGKALVALLVTIPAAAFLNSAPPTPKPAPQNLGGDGHCVPVGGTIMTNFGAIDPNTTLGPATGDLRGAVSATLMGAPQPGPNGTVLFHVQHHWVTDSGDNILFDPATATTIPISQTLFAIVTYPTHIIGGTGKFAGATGQLTNIGEADLTKGTALRYSGQVCFASSD